MTGLVARRAGTPSIGAFFLLAVLLWAWTAASASSRADGPQLKLTQYQHTTWTAEQGCPTGITHLAQTSDGYLWIATAARLVRFDGVSFESVDSLADAIGKEPVLSIAAARDGGLWIASASQLWHYFRGSLKSYPSSARWGSIQSLVERKDQTPWLVADGRIWTLEGGVMSALRDAWSYPLAGPVAMMAVDAAGTLWAVPAQGPSLAFLPDGTAGFHKVDRDLPSAQLRLGPDAELWFLRPKEFGLITDGAGEPSQTRRSFGTGPEDILLDRYGGAWLRARNGLTHVPDARNLLASDGSSNRLAVLDRRLSPVPEGRTAMLEDKEGDVWVGTTIGLERFHRPSLVPVELPRFTEVTAIAAGNNGEIWIAGSNDGVVRVSDRGAEHVATGRSPLYSLHRDGHGEIWAAGEELWRYRDGAGFTRVPMSGTSAVVARAMTSDNLGAISVGNENAVQRVSPDGSVKTVGPHRGQPSRVVDLLTDTEGRIWSADAQGITVIDRDSSRRFDVSKDGLQTGAIRTLFRGDGKIWVGGAEGLALFDGTRFRTYRGDRNPAFRNVTGIVETSAGDLWIQNRRFLLRLSVAEMIRAMGSPMTTVAAERFGIDGPQDMHIAGSTLVQSSDGRIWARSVTGLAWLDPLHTDREHRSPGVLMRNLFVDGKAYFDEGSPVTVPRSSQNFEFFYGAVGVSLPYRFRFRYRLDGVDSTWQEVGDRRSAFYSALAPGRYRFRVIIASNDGLWGNSEADFDFVVPPAWYQSAWFRFLCFLSLLLVIAAAFRARAHQLTAKMSASFATKQIERERIARELHDTLLQGTQGLIYAVQSAANQIDASSPAKASLEKALDRADAALAEGRDRIEGIRRPDHPAADLAAALRASGKPMAAGRAIAFNVSVTGTPSAMSPQVLDDAYGICREAILNAFQHADARSVTVLVAWEFHRLVISVRDDGRGIAPDVAHAKASPGHWGLRGMQERALALKSKLEIKGNVGGGTEVLLSIPAAANHGVFGRSWRTRFRGLR